MVLSFVTQTASEGCTLSPEGFKVILDPSRIQGLKQTCLTSRRDDHVVCKKGKPKTSNGRACTNGFPVFSAKAKFFQQENVAAVAGYSTSRFQETVKFSFWPMLFGFVGIFAGLLLSPYRPCPARCRSQDISFLDVVSIHQTDQEREEIRNHCHFYARITLKSGKQLGKFEESKSPQVTDFRRFSFGLVKTFPLPMQELMEEGIYGLGEFGGLALELWDVFTVI